MNPAHLQRLKKDSKELGHYAHKLTKKGNPTLAYKVAKRKDYLEQVILDLEERRQQ